VTPDCATPLRPAGSSDPSAAGLVLTPVRERDRLGRIVDVRDAIPEDQARFRSRFLDPEFLPGPAGSGLWLEQGHAGYLLHFARADRVRRLALPVVRREAIRPRWPALRPDGGAALLAWGGRLVEIDGATGEARPFASLYGLRVDQLLWGADGDEALLRSGGTLHRVRRDAWPDTLEADGDVRTVVRTKEGIAVAEASGLARRAFDGTLRERRSGVEATALGTWRGGRLLVVVGTLPDAVGAAHVFAIDDGWTRVLSTEAPWADAFDARGHSWLRRGREWLHVAGLEALLTPTATPSPSASAASSAPAAAPEDPGDALDAFLDDAVADLTGSAPAGAEPEAVPSQVPVADVIGAALSAPPSDGEAALADLADLPAEELEAPAGGPDTVTPGLLASALEGDPRPLRTVPYLPDEPGPPPRLEVRLVATAPPEPRPLFDDAPSPAPAPSVTEEALRGAFLPSPPPPPPEVAEAPAAPPASARAEGLFAALAAEDDGALAGLLSAGVDPEEPDRDGRRPLAVARTPAALRRLLAAGATAKGSRAKSRDGTPVLVSQAALDTQDRAARLRVLLAAGASPRVRDPSGRGALHHAARAGDLEAVRTLLAAGAPVSGPRGKAHPLHEAAAAGALDVVDVFLAAGAKVDVLDDVGRRTPLHRAAAMGHLDVVERLLEAGARVDREGGVLREEGRRTPLHDAAEGGRREVVERLLQAGARADRSTSAGRLPSDLAVADAALYFLLEDAERLGDGRATVRERRLRDAEEGVAGRTHLGGAPRRRTRAHEASRAAGGSRRGGGPGARRPPRALPAGATPGGRPARAPPRRRPRADPAAGGAPGGAPDRVRAGRPALGRVRRSRRHRHRRAPRRGRGVGLSLDPRRPGARARNGRPRGRRGGGGPGAPRARRGAGGAAPPHGAPRRVPRHGHAADRPAAPDRR
jgi:hypothetical protein